MSRVSSEDAARVAALHDYGVLDTPEEDVFDNITALCAELLDVPIALVSLVDAERQWFKSKVGLPVRETARSVAFCDHAIRESTPFVVADASEDERFADNPLVTADPCIRFYAGVQLRSPDGYALGTLCAIDRSPRRPSTRDIELLLRMARQVETQLELHRRTRHLERQMRDQAATQYAKEQLATMLVHDLRSPMTAIALAAAISDGAPMLEVRSNMKLIAEMAQEGQAMLCEVLDICLAETGELQPRRTEVALDEVVRSALRSVHPAAAAKGITLATEVASATVRVDEDLLRRSITNLADNAVRHSGHASEVRVVAHQTDGVMRLAVEDSGEGVPPREREHIFEPHLQAAAKRGARGLGLAFCKACAEAHGGRIWVEDMRPRGSRFVLELPVATGGVAGANH